jgi:lipopolysaccharide/colanic/teichoic acid biosynthesis glycosyltransferase
MKRVIDIVVSALGLVALSPLLAIFMLLIWRQDGRSPLYVALRAGKDFRPFRMVKLRSMVVGADRSGVASTSATDARITAIGRMVRRTKLDEAMQLWNVLKGDMSLVGPRPNVIEEVQLYTQEERKLLCMRPGITDLASIVFSDEGTILKDSPTPDLQYNQLIRPWKSRLGLLYVSKHSSWLDLRILLLTAMTIVDRQTALRGVNRILVGLGADQRLIGVAQRQSELYPFPPPGATEIVTQR